MVRPRLGSRRRDDEEQLNAVTQVGPNRNQDAFSTYRPARCRSPLAISTGSRSRRRTTTARSFTCFSSQRPRSLENPLVVPYYRDDACFDDGTGDNPSPRPYRASPATTPECLRTAAPAYTEAPEGYTARTGRALRPATACTSLHERHRTRPDAEADDRARRPAVPVGRADECSAKTSGTPTPTRRRFRCNVRCASEGRRQAVETARRPEIERGTSHGGDSSLF